MKRCPSDARLSQFARGQMTGPPAVEFELHLESCPKCARALAQLPAWSELVERLRELNENRVRDAELVRRVARRAAALGRTGDR